METKETSKPLEPLLPELKGKEAETLYILGNGFDIYHGLESRYSDFREWLLRKDQNHKYDEFVRNMERLFPLETNQDMLWCNFENALGQYEELMIEDDYTKEAHTSKDKEYGYREMTFNIENTCRSIRHNMTSWARNGIKIDKVKKKIDFSSDSWYFTFNYTRVLEEKYDIPPSHVCHIHGDISDSSYVITGHNNESEIDVHERYDDENDLRQVSLKAVIKEFDKQGKKPDEQMNKPFVKKFFSNIANVSHVVVIGHSLDNVDIEYFKKVQEIIRSDAEWHFCIHQPKDRFTIFKFIKELGNSLKRGKDVKLPVINNYEDYFASSLYEIGQTTSDD